LEILDVEEQAIQAFFDAALKCLSL